MGRQIDITRGVRKREKPPIYLGDIDFSFYSRGDDLEIKVDTDFQNPEAVKLAIKFLKAHFGQYSDDIIKALDEEYGES